MAIFHKDTNHLAMLAIPVILSGILTLSNDSLFDMSVLDDQEGKSAVSRVAFQNHDMEKNRRKLVQSAVADNNYETFSSAISGTPFGDIMTREAFTVLVEKYRMSKV